MSKQLLPLCSIQKVFLRDGYAGPLGRIFLPFQGYFFANGQQITEQNTAANKAQDNSINMQGQVKPNIFAKECCGPVGDSTGL